MVGTLRIRTSGPLQVAEIDCYSCKGLSTLTDPRCRACVFEWLGTEGAVDRVVLKRGYQRVYDSSGPSNLARTLAALKQLAYDRTLYASSEEGRCKECVDRRLKELTGIWPRLLENPHDPAPLDELKKKQWKLKRKCEDCTVKHFIKLIKDIKAGLVRAPMRKGSTATNYDDLFISRSKPFFVEGVWHPPNRPTRMIDNYALPEERGQVCIYEQIDRPVPFYELDLPEFKLPAEQLELLEEAFRLEVEEAPGHARFAYPKRIVSFAQDWYNHDCLKWREGPLALYARNPISGRFSPPRPRISYVINYKNNIAEGEA